MSGKLLEPLRGGGSEWSKQPRTSFSPRTRLRLLEAVRVQYPRKRPAASPRPDLQPSRISYLCRTGFEARHPVVILANADHNGLPQTDVLEAVLFIAGSKTNCRQTAEHALQALGSLGAVLSARVAELVAMLGIHDQIAYALKAMRAGMRSVLQEPIRERVLIQSSFELIDYLRLDLRQEAIDILRVRQQGPLANVRQLSTL
jgi:hypothetical protein